MTFVAPSSKVTVSSPLPLNAAVSGALIRAFGISTVLSAIQSSNTASPNFVRLFDRLTSDRLVHFQNARLPIIVTLSGILIVSRLLHCENADSPISVTVEGSVTCFKFPAFCSKRSIILVVPSLKVTVSRPLPWKTPLFSLPLISDKLPGICISFSAVQFSNALSPISFRFSGSFTVASALQNLNADFPIFVTLSGISIISRPVLLKNADSPISVTVAGIVTCFNLPVFSSRWSKILVVPSSKVTVSSPLLSKTLYPRPSPACTRLFGISISFNASHPLNTPLPRFVRLFGKFTVFSALHLKNADSPIFMTLSGITTFSRLLQFMNADFPISVTLSGIVTPVKVVLALNASAPITATVFSPSFSGMTSSASLPVYPVIVALLPSTVYVKSDSDAANNSSSGISLISASSRFSSFVSASSVSVSSPSVSSGSVSFPSAPSESVSFPSAPSGSVSFPSAPSESVSSPSAPSGSVSFPSVPSESVSFPSVSSGFVPFPSAPPEAVSSPSVPPGLGSKRLSSSWTSPPSFKSEGFVSDDSSFCSEPLSPVFVWSVSVKLLLVPSGTSCWSLLLFWSVWPVFVKFAAWSRVSMSLFGPGFPISASWTVRSIPPPHLFRLHRQSVVYEKPECPPL